MEKNAGYTIRRSVLFEGGSGFALGENLKAPAPFVTWQFNDTDRGRSYFWGHYYADLWGPLSDLLAQLSAILTL